MTVWTGHVGCYVCLGLHDIIVTETFISNNAIYCSEVGLHYFLKSPNLNTLLPEYPMQQPTIA